MLFPLIFMGLVILMLIVVAQQAAIGNVPTESAALTYGSLVGLGYVLTIVSMFASYFYAIHRMYTRTSLDDKSKLFWLWMIALFSPISIPILHFKHLRDLN